MNIGLKKIRKIMQCFFFLCLLLALAAEASRTFCSSHSQWRRASRSCISQWYSAITGHFHFLRETLPRPCPFLTPSLVIQWGCTLSSGISVQTYPIKSVSKSRGSWPVTGLVDHAHKATYCPSLSLLPRSPISVNGTTICPRAKNLRVILDSPSYPSHL